MSQEDVTRSAERLPDEVPLGGAHPQPHLSGSASSWVVVLMVSAWVLLAAGGGVWIAGLSALEAGDRAFWPWTLSTLVPAAFCALLFHGLAVVLDQVLELRADLASEPQSSTVR